MQGNHVARAIESNYLVSAYLRNIHITQSDICNASSSIEVVHGEVNNQAYNPRALDPRIYSLRVNHEIPRNLLHLQMCLF